MSLVEEVEHFPWGVVNGLTKVSPYTLKKVEIALKLWVQANAGSSTILVLSRNEYKSYFRQVRSALPELDKKLVMSIAVRHSSRLLLELTCP